MRDAAAPAIEAKSAPAAAPAPAEPAEVGPATTGLGLDDLIALSAAKLKPAATGGVQCAPATLLLPDAPPLCYHALIRAHVRHDHLAAVLCMIVSLAPGFHARCKSMVSAAQHHDGAGCPARPSQHRSCKAQQRRRVQEEGRAGAAEQGAEAAQGGTHGQGAPAARRCCSSQRTASGRTADVRCLHLSARRSVRSARTSGTFRHAVANPQLRYPSLLPLMRDCQSLAGHGDAGPAGRQSWQAAGAGAAEGRPAHVVLTQSLRSRRSPTRWMRMSSPPAAEPLVVARGAYTGTRAQILACETS